MLIIRTAEEIAADAARAEAARRQSEARALLAETDWYVVRLAETGAALPEAVSRAREAARALLSESRP